MKTFIAALSFVAAVCIGNAAAAGNVIQTAQFPGLTPETLYSAFLSAREHAAMTGYPARMVNPSTGTEVAVAQEGDEWHAFGVTGKDGKLQYLIGGRILRLIPGREIVMTWRAGSWTDAKLPPALQPESVLVLTFRRNAAGAEIDLVQVNVPDDAAVDPASGELTSETSHVNTNWYFRYWQPMTKYFQSLQSKPSS